jgi:hypothetical protein
VRSRPQETWGELLRPAVCRTKEALWFGVVRVVVVVAREDPINGCQIGTKYAIVDVEQDQLYPIHFSDGCQVLDLPLGAMLLGGSDQWLPNRNQSCYC